MNIVRDEWRLSQGDDYFNETISIYVIHHDGQGGMFVAKPVAFDLDKTAISVGRIIDPTMRIDTENAQGIFQKLWDMGFRPKNGESSMAHVEAMKYHLEDMRKLAFRKK